MLFKKNVNVLLKRIETPKLTKYLIILLRRCDDGGRKIERN